MIGRGDLTPSLARLVAALHGASALREGGRWVTPQGRRFQPQTMEAAHDRCLVKIVTESRHRRRYSAELTEIGNAVARDLARQDDGTVSEDAAILIQEIVARAA